MTHETAAIFAGFFFNVRLIQDGSDHYRVQVTANHPDGNHHQREATTSCLTQAHVFFTSYVADVIASEAALAQQNPGEMHDIAEGHTELWQESYDRDASLRQIIAEQVAQYERAR